jgi:alkanesulfonate monooxygenase SsuD/methylene tetrahydromethanopterin reductase-like flavin-dependent oxidoreductase (luciferase family)
MGHAATAARVQELYLKGDVRAAELALPDELIDEVALVGPPERIREQLDHWRDSPITVLVLNTASVEVLEAIAEAMERETG